MRFLAGFATAVLVLLAFLVVNALSTDPLALGDTGANGTGRILVTATLTAQHNRELGAVGRQSNVVEQAWRLNDRHGRPIGKMISLCRWVVRTARFCQTELMMPRGKITASGSSRTALEGEYAVTGGTGFYSAGGGVMQFTAIGLRKTVLLITIET